MATQSWRDVADYRRMGHEFTLTPPPGVSPETETVKRIQKEIDPWFVPLWVNREFQNATGGTFRTISVVLGRYRKNPPPNARVIKGLPLGPKGEKIQLICIVDGLEDSEREKGKPPTYVPLSQIYEDLKLAYAEMAQTREFMDAAADDQAQDAAWAADEQKRKAALIEEVSYMRHNNRDQLNRMNGYTGRTFVSSALNRLREIAGDVFGVPSSSPGEDAVNPEPMPPEGKAGPGSATIGESNAVV